MPKYNKIWVPHEGSQKKFMQCPIWECLLCGNRGGGKTDVLLMDFLQDVDKGYGPDYRGLILREATTELEDVIAKTKKWIPQIFPSAKFNNSKKVWLFEKGETLRLSYARTEEDYWQYHGSEIPFIGWEELTNWPFPDLYLKLMSINRSSNTKVPRKYRATCNPSGPGNAWVKERFIDMGPAGKVFTDEYGQKRTYIVSSLEENKILLEADPTYQAKLLALTEGNKMLRDAWILGSWDLLIGGFFTDVWDKEKQVLDPFPIPKSWRLTRSFDWGSSKPWAVTYGFETNGEQPRASWVPYLPKGTIIIPNEIYGWTGKVNEGDQATSEEIAKRVLSVDKALFTEYGIKCYPGPADTSIWEVRDGTSIANNMSTYGCRWTKAYKGSGSRISGWALVRQMLNAAKMESLESPHLHFFSAARNHLRTLPMLQRDTSKPEDIDTDLEDHCADSLRYLLSRKVLQIKRKKVRT
jgi:hypothetical protein